MTDLTKDSTETCIPAQMNVGDDSKFQFHDNHYTCDDAFVYAPDVLRATAKLYLDTRKPRRTIGPSI